MPDLTVPNPYIELQYHKAISFARTSKIVKILSLFGCEETFYLCLLSYRCIWDRSDYLFTKSNLSSKI